MILRIQCPNCDTAYRLQDPLPPEGKRYRCKCKAVITVDGVATETRALFVHGSELPDPARRNRNKQR